MSSFSSDDSKNGKMNRTTDCTLADEFSHIKRWADTNGLIINFDKTKELVRIHRPHVSSLSAARNLLTTLMIGSSLLWEMMLWLNVSVIKKTKLH